MRTRSDSVFAAVRTLFSRRAGSRPTPKGSSFSLETLENRELLDAGLGRLTGLVQHSDGLVTGLYQTLLGRSPDAAGQVFWQSHLANGMAPGELATSLLASEEYAIRNVDWLAGLYRDALGRFADADGLDFWEDALDRGVGRSLVAQAMLNSPEALTLAGTLVGLPLAVELRDLGPEALTQLHAVAAAEQAEVLETGIAGLYRVQGTGAALERLGNHLRGASFVASVAVDSISHVQATPNDPSYANLWGLNGTFGVDAPRAWDMATGSTRVTVAVIDTGVDYNHPDLYKNIWLNQGEIPASRRANLTDIDGDGLITFWDLNETVNQGTDKIRDVNGDGRITGSDVLAPFANGGWANGISDDGDTFRDDLLGWNFINNTNNPMDDNNHGTHVAGTIGAVGNNGVGVVGVNWKTQIMALKFLGASGSGATSGAAASVRYAADHGAKISNNSYGGGSDSSLRNAISYSASRGHLFAASAGNSNRNIDFSPTYPASYDLPNIVSVAAIDRNGNRASFSNYGSLGVDLGAPGVSITSTVRGGGYASFSGTSMAAPHVAGAAALAWSQHLDWTGQQVKDFLLSKTTPLASMAGRTVTGGRLNVSQLIAAPTSLPFAEDFEDGLANHMTSVAGSWTVSSGRTQATAAVGGDAISRVLLHNPLPGSLEVLASLGASAGTGGRSSNAAIVFDYQSPTNFKYALLAFTTGSMALGQRSAAGWQDALTRTNTGIIPATDYAARVHLEPGGRVTLQAHGQTLTHTFADSLTDGALGVGGQNSISHFNDLRIHHSAGGATLPYSENFADAMGDHLAIQAGTWSVQNGVYQGSAPAGATLLTTLALRDPLPATVQFQATLRSDPWNNGRQSNAALIFDYHSPTEFKYAQLGFGGNAMVFGQRTATGWQHETIMYEVGIVSNTDYTTRLVLQSGGRATLEVNGRVLTHTFADGITDGGLGLGASNARSWFDNLVVSSLV